MSFSDNRLAQAVSEIQTPLKNISVIYGTKGYIEMPEWWKAQKVVLKTEEREDVFIDDRESWGYDFETREVKRLIKEGKTESPVVNFEKSIQLMEILDEVRDQIGLRYPFE